MTEWFTTRWAALDTWGRIATAMFITGTVLNTLACILNPTTERAALAATMATITYLHANTTYWREQALNWCAMNDLARTIAHALDRQCDVLISTDSNGNDAVVVIDKEGNHL